MQRARRLAALFAPILAACQDTGTREVALGAADASPAALVRMHERLAPRLPGMRASVPVDRSIEVPRDEWLRVEFERALPEGAALGIALACDGEPLGASVSPLGDRALVVNPDGSLPAAADCELRWRGGDGPRRVRFTTAGAGVPAFVRYDRRDSRATAPFPDDFWLRTGEGEEGGRLSIQLNGFREPSQSLISAFVAGAQGLDGFSPIAHLTIALSEAPDVSSLPRTPAESLDPLASVGLFDLTPGSPTYGARVPFRLEARSEAMGSRAPSHSLLLYPSHSLTSSGRYGLVVTRRARVSAARPFEPSPFFAMALAAAQPGVGEDPSVARVRALASDVLDAVAIAAQPPIPREDVALAVRISVRSTREIPRDLLAIRQQIFSAPPPRITVARVEPESAEAIQAGSEVAAIVTGTWQAPDFRDGNGNLARDPANGRPVRTRTRPVGFVLALPSQAQTGPVPVTIYQHGNPGSAEEEVVEHARRSLAALGFAVIGFTDVVNREISPPGTDPELRAQLQVTDLLLHLLLYQRVPDCWVETNAEQLAFLRAIGELARLPRFDLPATGADPARAIFGIDAAQPLTIEGVSEGASLVTSLLPYAPEIRAAALIAGGRRYSEVLIHQQARVFLDHLAHLGFDDLVATDVWVALSLFQTLLDPQDPHLHAPFLWRERLALPGSSRRASVLLVEGVGDGFVPNHATESLAAALGGVALVEPGLSSLPGLAHARPPLAGNVDTETTGALVQWTPLGILGREPTPGCSDPRAGPVAWEAHYCAQTALESSQQRAAFFASALGGGAPVVVDPLGN